MNKKIVERLKKIGLKEVLVVGGPFLAMILLANITTTKVNAKNIEDYDVAVAPKIETTEKLNSKEVNSMDSRKNYVAPKYTIINKYVDDLLVDNYVVSFDKDGNNLGVYVGVDALPKSKLGQIESKEYHGLSGGASSEDWVDALRDINESVIKESKYYNIPRVVLNLEAGTYADCGISYQSLENVQVELTDKEHKIINKLFRKGITAYYTTELEFFMVKNGTVLKATKNEQKLLETLENKLRTVNQWLGLDGDAEAYRCYYNVEDTNSGPDKSKLKLSDIENVKTNEWTEYNDDNFSLKEDKNA